MYLSTFSFRLVQSEDGDWSTCRHVETFSVLTLLYLGSVVGHERRDASTGGQKRNFICINQESTNFSRKSRSHRQKGDGEQFPYLRTHSSVTTCEPRCNVALFARCMWTDTRRYMPRQGVWTAVIALKTLGITVWIHSPGRQAVGIGKSKAHICILVDYSKLPFDLDCIM